MSESFPLPTEPECVIPSLIARFNSGLISALMALHDPKSVFAENDGRTTPDRVELTARLERDLKLGLPLAANVRHVFVAQIVADWSIDAVGPDGGEIHLKGSACDMARRGPDGLWRYLIDNNQGSSVRQTVQDMRAAFHLGVRLGVELPYQLSDLPGAL